MSMLICICENDASTASFLKMECEKFYNNKREHLDFIIYDNGEALVKNKHDFDLIFLDIELNGLNGLEAAVRLREFNVNSQIIIVSGYLNYKSSAYAAHVFDFIDKPIQEIRLYDVLSDLEMYFKKHQHSRSIYYNINGNIYQTDIQDILYLEVVDRKIRLVLKDKSYSFYGNLHDYQNLLLENGFGIPHRTYLVNYENIKFMGKDYITMTNGDAVAIARPRSKSFRHDYMEYINDYLFKKKHI